MTKQLDPIYTRTNPVATEIIETQSEQSKKRLFAKKHEKPTFEHSVSNSSCVSKNSSIDFSRPVKSDEKPVVANTVKAVKSKNEKNKSKSSTDLLFYNFEHSNSTLDLLEIINDCDAPKGDLNHYKEMIDECEKLEKSCKIPSTPTTPLTARKLPQKITLKDKILNKNNPNKTPRSHSAPSYTRNPVIHIIDYDQLTTTTSNKNVL
jgi:hypothetical protein